VHNRRDLFDARYLYGLRNVVDHPLSFLGANETERIRQGASRQQFPMLDELPPDAALVGAFASLTNTKASEL
jgi:hypothetical protein